MPDFRIESKSSRELIRGSGLPVVIYGMGNGADKIIDEFTSLGIEIAGVSASDSFVRGQIFRGFKVKKLSEFEGDFIVAPAFGTSVESVMNHIINLSGKYRVIYPVVPVAGNEILTDELIEREEDKINRAYRLFSGRSAEVFEKCFNFIYSGDLKYLLEATDGKDEIFNSFLRLPGRGAYIDVGAYRGETVEEYLRYTNGRHGKIIALEPDKKSCEKARAKFTDKDITVLNKAAGDTDGTVLFESLAGRQSSVSDKGSPVECVKIDTLCENIETEYIKMDTEGFEIPAVNGAKETIKRDKPALNIALYHRIGDLWEIPLLINEICPGYRFEIRHHPYFPCWDTNLYCKYI